MIEFRIFGNIWKYLEIFGNIWKYLEYLFQSVVYFKENVLKQ
jgi:hypothetical protein